MEKSVIQSDYFDFIDHELDFNDKVTFKNVKSVQLEAERIIITLNNDETIFVRRNIGCKISYRTVLTNRKRKRREE